MSGIDKAKQQSIFAVIGKKGERNGAFVKNHQWYPKKFQTFLEDDGFIEIPIFCTEAYQGAVEGQHIYTNVLYYVDNEGKKQTIVELKPPFFQDADFEGEFISLHRDELDIPPLPGTNHAINEAEEWFEGFWIPPKFSNYMNAAKKVAAVRGNSVISLLGKSGIGKTETAIKFLQRSGIPYEVFNFQTIVEHGNEMLATRELRNDETVVELTEVGKFLFKEKGLRCLVIDELSRANQFFTNVLLSLFDQQQQITIFGQTYQVNPQVLYILTENYGSEYTATTLVDGALQNRKNFVAYFDFNEYPKEVVHKILMNVYEKYQEDSYVDAQEAADIATAMQEVYAKLVENQEEIDCILTIRPLKESFFNCVIGGLNITDALESVISQTDGTVPEALKTALGFQRSV